MLEHCFPPHLVGPEVHRGVHPPSWDPPAPDVFLRAPVGGEEEGLPPQMRQGQVAQVGQVLAVAAVGAVLVLDL